jgi:hypothetical protein
MSRQEVFKPNGDGFDITPAGVLLLAAETVYGDPGDSTPEGRRHAQALLDEMMAAARAGGYAQCDILLTLVASGKLSRRLVVMAQEACDAAGPAAMREAFAKSGL